MSDKELQAWLTLWRVKGIGPVIFRELLAYFETASAVLSASRQSLVQSGLRQGIVEGILSADKQVAAADLKWLEQPQHHILTWQDPAYPPLLAELSNAAPPILFVNGDLEVLSQPQLAMVGTRNPTTGGAQNAREFARDLSTQGLCITSGLAYGIDTESHQGALDKDNVTIAVMATGPERIYPARNRALAHKIVEQGALVTEFPVGVKSLAQNFPRRNRIISGLSLGALVIEAAHRSGSLITARFANEQGREVFAIPGSIHNPLAKGCHQLIRQGAKLVETAQDILEELGPLLEFTLEFKNHALPAINNVNGALMSSQDSSEQGKILNALGYDPQPIDRLVETTGLTPDVVSSMLLLLELQGLVATVSGGTYVRTR